MLSFKKLTATLLAVSMVAAMGTTVFADDSITTDINVQEEIRKAKAGISDVPVTDEMADAIAASYTDSDGNIFELEVLTTVSRVESKGRSADAPEMYSITGYVTGEQKVESENGSSGNSDVPATGSFTMVWIDVKGIQAAVNEIVSLSGNWSSYESTFKSGSLNWGSSSYSQAGFMEVGSYFAESVNYTGSSLGARSRATFTRNVNGVLEEGLVKIELDPSIWD